ncbi:B-cell receptor CD22-like isoform X3 [Pygocentrus nattereri]|uniref:B-cell receptor CD22-like isoform X3 n=1 Tax=Pygocentrus nattereri TaxID=42514 RepID=UPI0018914931|nr:B-cell receptor CD22-like isoform X3 [Pygocentrus nattereri]
MTSLRVPLSFPLLCLLMIVGTFGTEWSVKYNQQEICALKGSTVFMNGTFTHPEGLTVTEKFWVIDPALNPSWPDMSQNPDYSGRVEYLGDEQKLVSLKLRDVMKKDEHEYCVRIKTDQEMQKYLQRPGVRLTVTELHVEAPEEVTEGQTADLTCKTTCSLTDPFIWYKNGHPLTTKTIKNNQLHLQTVSSEDAGSYSCAVGGSQHLHSTAHSLRVRYPPKSVSVSISPSGEIVEGSSVTLTCSSDGNPPVKIYTWFKGSTPVGEGKNYSIPNIRSEDSGEYRCQSWNDHGQRISTAVHLNVLYPPKRVSVSISLMNSGKTVEGSSVTLTCSSDGNPPVKNYTWFKEGGTSPVGSGHSYSIINIPADHTGLYYCEAQNDHGALNGTVMVTVKSQCFYGLLTVWIAVGGGSVVFINVSICICLMMKRAAGKDHHESQQDDVPYTTVTRRTARPAQAADSAASGAADVLYDTVRIQNDEVTSTDQQGEHQYASVTFHHPAATGPGNQYVDTSVIYSTVRKD